MFNRVQIKENAKLVLKRSYWMAFLVALLASLVISGSGISGNFNFGFNTNDIEELSNALEGNMSDGINDFVYSIEDGTQNSNNAIDAFSESMDALSDFVQSNGGAIGKMVGAGVISVTLISLLWAMFVSSPASNGLARFFIATREQQNPVEFSYVLYGFKKNYIKQSWARFSTDLIVMLWQLLAVVPEIVGIVLMALTKQEAFAALSILTLPLSIWALIVKYKYYFVSYILANNGEITGKRAREISTDMTDGNKWNMFVFDLSFIGWFLLGALCCGIGILFVMPYYEAARAEAFTCLKAEVIQQKAKSNDAELPSLAGAEY